MSRNAALFIEIAAVTVIGWIVVEPVAVKTSVASLPAGYDHERLVLVHVNTIDKAAAGYDSTAISRKDACPRLLEMLRQREGVEHATYTPYQSMERESKAMSYLDVDSTFFPKSEDQERGVGVIFAQYVPESDFFATFGIRAPGGKPFVEPRSEEHSYIVSETVAGIIYHGKNIIGRNLYPYDGDDEDDYRTPIVGITADVLYNKGDDRTPVAFMPISPDVPLGFTVRLKEGVSARDFADRLTTDLSDYRVGNVYLTHPEVYSDMRDEIFSADRKTLLRGWLVVLFFLANVLLGVAGTFYVQTKRRISDAGVMRAFGATRRRVEAGIIGEACVIAFAAWAAGSAIYLCYLYFSGDPAPTDVSYTVAMLRPMWYDTSFTRHAVTATLLLCLLLVLAALGAWLPARKVGRVNPIEALRDE